MTNQQISEYPARRAVLVLGPHRAGTSATTRLLNLLGVDLGRQDQLIGAGNQENLKGFFENRIIMRINDGVLSQQGGTWSHPPPLEPGWQRDPGLNRLRDEAREVLEENFAAATLWGFKDPRVCLTLPFWRDLIGPVSYVVCVRNALEVTGSLVRRDGLSRAAALEIWTRHVAGAILHSAGERRIFVAFDELFTERDRAVRDLAAFVGAPELGVDSEFLTLVDEFLEGDLKHHAEGLGEVVGDPGVPGDTRVLQALLELAVRVRDSEPALRGAGSGGSVDTALDAAAARYEVDRLDRLARLRRRPRPGAATRAPTPTRPLSMVTRALDFVIVGTGHGGLAALWDLLHDHPQLALEREGDDSPLVAGPERFGDERWGEPGLTPTGALRGTLTGESLGEQGVTFDELMMRIGMTAPRAKLIVLVREPVERAVDHHRRAVADGRERRPVVRALREQMTPGALAAARRCPNATNSYVVLGEYGRLLAACRRQIPDAPLLWLSAGELERDPSPALGRVLRFLEIDARWRPADLRRRARPAGDRPLVAVDREQSLVRRLQATVFPLAGAHRDSARRAFLSAFADWNRGEPYDAPPLPAELVPALEDHFRADALLAGEDVLPWAQRVPAPAVVADDPRRPAVSIAIPVRGAQPELGGLLPRLQATAPGCEILLVDRSGSDADRESVAALGASSGARMIAAGAGATEAAALNLALAEARAGEVVLLAADCLPGEGWLEALRAALAGGDDIAAVGPRSNFARGPQGGVWLDDTSVAGIDRFSRMFNRADPGRRFTVLELDRSALLVRRRALEEIGGLRDPAGDGALGDRDLGERLRAAGHRLLCAGDAFVYRAGAGSVRWRGYGSDRVGADSPAARLMRDPDGRVFEVLGGVACPVHGDAALALIRDGRPVEDAPDGLEALAAGPSVRLCRELGGDAVWLLHGHRRRCVVGDPHRIRRLPDVGAVAPADLPGLERDPDVDVATALVRVAELPSRLPVNPAAIDPERLAEPGTLVAEVGAALEAGRGYAAIALGAHETLVLADGEWGAPPSAELPPGTGPTARELRDAIIGADAVGVTVARHSELDAPLLEQVLFHLDLYPPLRFDAAAMWELLGFDGITGRTLGAAPLRELLAGRPVAVVGPLAADARRFADLIGYEVSLAVELRPAGSLDDALLALATDRGGYDAVLVAAGPQGRVLCSRLARELDAVALDIGDALGRMLYERHGLLTPREVLARFTIDRYLREAAAPPPRPAHPLEGRLVRVPGRAPVFYVERGRARSVSHRALVAHLGGVVEAIDAGTLAALPRGAPLYAVRPRGSERLHLLLDGAMVPLTLGLAIPEADLGSLDALPSPRRSIEWFPGAATPAPGAATPAPLPAVTVALPGEGRPAPDIGFVMCVEAGPLENQAVMLCESMRTFGGRFSGAALYAVAPRPGLGISPGSRDRLADLGVHYIEESLNVGGDLATMPVQGNKPLSAAHVEGQTDHELVVVMDTDTVVLSEPGELELAAGEDVALRPADMRGIATTGQPGDPRDDYWRRLCAFAGVAYDRVPWTRTFVDELDVKAYYQTGCVVVRREVGVFRSWARLLSGSAREGIGPDLDDRPKATSVGPSSGRGSTWWGVDIPTLSLAIWASTDRVRLLTSRYNYPLHLHGRLDPAVRAGRAHALTIVHYHWLFNADRLAENPLLAPSFELPPATAEWLLARVPLDDGAHA